MARVSARALWPAASTAARLNTMGTADLLRWCFVVVVALFILGTGTELAMLRHWGSTLQLVPWLFLGLLTIAVLILALRPSARAVYLVRALAVVIGAGGIFGVWAHSDENYESGPLDYRYIDSWATTSELERWWAAVTKTVGPAPPVAPAALAQAALILIFATIRHPALDRGPRKNEGSE